MVLRAGKFSEALLQAGQGVQGMVSYELPATVVACASSQLKSTLQCEERVMADQLEGREKAIIIEQAPLSHGG